MIEVVEARNGFKVIRWGGRLMSSAVDPAAEAAEWLQRRMTMLTRVKTVFLLGAGSGWHIEEICRQTKAQLIVIDSEPKLIAAVQKIHGFSPMHVRFEHVTSAKELRACESVRAAVAESFIVLTHAPSAARDTEFFADVTKQLLGRDWGSLNWQWQLKNLAPLDSQTRIHGAEDGEALTIYDLDKTELIQDSAERERMLVKALRELVK